MKKGQIYEGTAGEIRFPNRTVVTTAEGEECIVPNALPGQKVEFRVTKAHNGRFEGILLQVLEKSEAETAKTETMAQTDRARAGGRKNFMRATLAEARGGVMPKIEGMQGGAEEKIRMKQATKSRKSQAGGLRA